MKAFRRFRPGGRDPPIDVRVRLVATLRNINACTAPCEVFAGGPRDGADYRHPSDGPRLSTDVLREGGCDVVAYASDACRARPVCHAYDFRRPDGADIVGD